MKRFRVVCGLALVLCGAGAAAPLGSGIDKANFDASIKPGDNFFRYVNGTWMKNNPIPPEFSRWGAFALLRDQNTTRLHEVLEGLQQSAAELSPTQTKLRDFYKSAMDEATLENLGAQPIAAELAAVDKITTADELVAALGDMRVAGRSEIFSLSVNPDEKHSDTYAVHLHQGGLTLPERDYYLSTSEEMQKLRAQYLVHVRTMFTLLGDSEAAATEEAADMLGIETELAQTSRTPVQLRDQEANYNKKTLAELSALTPNFNWSVYLKPLQLGDLHEVIVGQPEFFARVSQLLTFIPAAHWRAYLRWHLIHPMAPYLSSKFENENYHFFSEIMRGTKQMQPRWKRAVGTVDREMGEALGQLYAGKYFPPEAKTRMNEMVKNLLAAYRERMENLDWMGPETKKQALIKLDAVARKIGYPDKWRDYSALDVQSDSYAKNILRSAAFESRYRLAKLGKPVDRDEWHMTPQTVNAYYNGTMNEIVFPAGILQPPFFNFEADDAVNYGSIGAVIGHEITHGFDDQGSRSDAQGNLREWWTPEDRARFKAKTDKLVAQYDACRVVGDLTINGRLTLGENLADLGGVTIAFAAYQKSLQGKEALIIDGFTGPQRFFIGYAQVWADNIRDADQRMLLHTDPHSPAQFRTLVPLSNIQAFYDAFNVKPGDTMYRALEDRVTVW